MKTYTIWSETISNIEYDDIRGDLYIHFHDGKTGAYKQVPKYKIDLFLESRNSEGFYNNNFKNKFHEVIF